MFKVPNNARLREGRFRSTEADGNNGIFLVTVNGKQWTVVASDGANWEHVSVSRPDETPSWEVMCKVKDLFWDAEDVVVQYHPAKSTYVNFSQHCLHMWRPIGVEFPTPATWMVGPTGGRR